MSVLVALISGLARRVISMPVSVPDAMQSAAASSVQPERRQTASEAPENNMYEQFVRSRFNNSAAMSLPLQFVRSPLADDRFAGRDDIDIAFRDRAVQSAAAELSGKLDRLRALCGYHSCISMGVCAVLAEQPDDGAISTDAVAQRLRQFAEEVEDQMASARENIAAHNAAALTRKMKHGALRSACSTLHSALVAEFNHHVEADKSAARAAAMNLPTRYSILRNAGVPEPLIAASEPTALDPAMLAQRRRGRIAEIKAAVVRLEAFQADPTFDAAPITGLDPAIDNIIAARDGAKVAA